ncbi:hypothetical protein KAJ02_13365 [Candidatus Bipolaricaulota bacterium]|nr:hypothetical protein [Dehalococcoidia bacterium]MCK5587055.1 hypothetical protein [Candidatus Bipolaricaulota bacterium]
MEGEAAEKKGRQTFEGYHITEDAIVETALQEYKEADEHVWTLTLKYLYPPEEIPFEGVRQLVFPSEAARDEYDRAKTLSVEARERYEQIAKERSSKDKAT